ncbi:MAG: sulfotransferase domain-containing protein [Lentisphaeria bacterium]|nr:sulfotransferase domain-containing protein [Lentisphaeria bacterium]NQZ67965.1 sulfotransferase domain-containing protein [Lentisphaeria bacterium]
MIITDNPVITENDQKLYQYLSEQQRYLSEQQRCQAAILLSGYYKSGNTWCRFLIYNYFNCLLHGAEKTLTFTELAKLQPHMLDKDYDKDFSTGYPIFYRTHNAYTPVFDIFSTVIYIYRNPMDTLISAYHYFKDRQIPFYDFPEAERQKLEEIDYFIISQFRAWIFHYILTQSKAHILINYDSAQIDPYPVFEKLLQRISGSVNEGALEKAIDLSSFDNVKKMSIENNQQNGMAPKAEFKGQFLRSGKSGQYNDVLKEETVATIKQLLIQNNIAIY